MKYNLTNETYLPEITRNFPGAPEMTFASILTATFMMNIIPLGLSALTYYPIVIGIKKLFGQVTLFSLLLTGTILTLTTPLIYLIANGTVPFKYNSQIISWILSYLLSLTTYLLLNKETLDHQMIMTDNDLKHKNAD
jgi:hypothetical protein